MAAANSLIILCQDKNRRGVHALSCVWCVCLLVPFYTFYHFQPGKGSDFGARLKDPIVGLFWQ